MRKRSHRSALVLAALVAWLLVVPGSASADGITVTIPVNVTNIHEEAVSIKLKVEFKEQQNGANYMVGYGWSEPIPIVNRSVQQDVEVLVSQGGSQGGHLFDADNYKIVLHLIHPSNPNPCQANWSHPQQSSTWAHCNEGWSEMQTYQDQIGPLSNLVPE